MMKKIKKFIPSIIGFIFIAIIKALEHINFDNVYVLFAITVLGIFFTGRKIFIKSLKNIKNKNFFDENFLMSFASVISLCLKNYDEALAILTLYSLGEGLQDLSVDKARREISALAEIQSDIAFYEKDGALVQVNASKVRVDDIIVVRPGDRVPVDGVVLNGEGQINTQALTGESVPRSVRVNDEVLSGSINETSVIKLKVLREQSQSAASRILEMVEEAIETKSKAEGFITKFAKIYTPIVLLCALLVVAVPTLFFKKDIAIWGMRALNFLIISCPCALVISVPLSFFSAIGRAAKVGVLFKGSEYIELLSKVKCTYFDKTGTLTKGVFEVTSIHPEEVSKEELLKLTASAEMYSNHPIAHSLILAFGKELDKNSVTEVCEMPGFGVKAKVGNDYVIAGNEKLFKRENIEICECPHCQGAIGKVHVAKNGKYVGHIVISDSVKEDSLKLMPQLKKMKVRTAMLTGDKKIIGEEVANKLNMDEVYCDLLPEDKVQKIDEAKQNIKNSSSKATLVYVGDGINDAPSLLHSDVGIVVGSLSSQAASQAADVVIADDSISKVAWIIKYSKKTIRVVRECIVMSLGIKVAVSVASIFGYAPIWLALLADVGVCLLAILNALKLWLVR